MFPPHPAHWWVGGWRSDVLLWLRTFSFALAVWQEHEKVRGALRDARRRVPRFKEGTSGTWAELYCDREARATLSGATADARVGALARQAWVLANSVVCLPSESPHLARAPVAPDKDGEADLVTLLGAAFGSADVVWDISEPASHARPRTQFARCSRCSFVPCAYDGLCGVFLAQATVPYNRLPAASTQRLVCATG